MAAGTVTVSSTNKAIEILSAATATNSPPSGATSGFALDQVFKGPPHDGILFIKSTAGSGTMTVTIKVWGYLGAAAAWVPYGAHATAASRGLINLTNAIDEQQPDLLRHSEVIVGPWAFDRIYLEITAIGGTSTAVSAWLVVPAGG